MQIFLLPSRIMAGLCWVSTSMCSSSLSSSRCARFPAHTRLLSPSRRRGCMRAVGHIATAHTLEPTKPAYMLTFTYAARSCAWLALLPWSRTVCADTGSLLCGAGGAGGCTRTVAVASSFQGAHQHPREHRSPRLVATHVGHLRRGRAQILKRGASWEAKQRHISLVHSASGTADSTDDRAGAQA